MGLTMQNIASAGSKLVEHVRTADAMLDDTVKTRIGWWAAS